MTRRAGREWRIAHTSDIQATGANAWSETLALACRQRVVPVARIDALEAVGPLAEALVAGGAAVIEVTLRTPHALRAIELLAEDGRLLVGGGTVLTREHVDAAKSAGARFAVSPGMDDAVVERCRELELPLLPGVATASELMRALAEGLTLVKLFPAEAIGGVGLIGALAGPFPDARFVPTGGIDASNAADYLRHPAVAAIGGSWMVAPKLLAGGDYAAVERLTAEALELGRAS